MIMNKILGLASIVILFVCCASTSEHPKNSILRSVDLYENDSFDEVWTAVIEVLQELDYEVRKESREKGFIDAMGLNETDSHSEQTLLNIIIRDEDGRVRVDCLAVTPDGAEGPARAHNAVSKFYAALNKKLGSLK